MKKNKTQKEEMAPVPGLSPLVEKILSTPGEKKLHLEFLHFLKALDTRRYPYFNNYQADFCLVLAIIFKAGTVNHQALAPIAARQLTAKYRLQEDEGLCGKELWPLFAEDIVFLSYLEKTINRNYDMETFLVRLRRSLLLDYQSSTAMSPENLSLAAAVAHQCFNNEYIFHESREEQKIVAGLEKDTVHDFSTGNWQDKESLVVILSMYRGLSRLACAKSLCRVSLKHLPPLLHRCLIRFVHEPFREKKLSEEIPSIGITDSKTSHAISRQYEENPYPRWFSLGEKSNSLAQKLEKDFPAYIAPGALGNKRVRILVAGSGSGWQPLALARANSGAEIVAVDLSRSSLAYGMRMAEKFAISNVTFLHGDLLEIMRLGQTFHHIACYGVLHHMEKPDEGWQALDNVLLPGGTFHIGLYSRVARLPVVFIRNEIKKKNLQPTVENMKNFRGLLLKEPRYRQIRDYFISSTDFYNLSTLRDLLFNASEMQYTIPRLQKTIHHFDYIFLGFHLRSPAMQKRYRQQFPADTGYTSMQNWLSFEKAYTGTGNMLDFWLQKRYG